MLTHPFSLTGCLGAHAVDFPDKNAFIGLDNNGEAVSVVTWRQLHIRVQSVAVPLAQRALQGSNVLLVYQDILQFIIAFMACQYSGIIPVPVSSGKGRKQAGRLQAIAADAGAAAILCCEQAAADLQQAGLPVIRTDIALPELTVNESYHPVALIQYTSGSTGLPKGVVVTRENLLHNLELIRNTFGTSASSVIYSWLPFHHDMGLIGNILHTIYLGCTCVLMSPVHFMQQPKSWLEGISRYRATHSGGPDFAYALCADRISDAELASLDLSCWSVAYNGSQPVRQQTLQRFAARFAGAGFNEQSFYPCYGLAEATLLVSGKKTARLHAITATGDARVLVSNGRIPPGMKVKIIDTQTRQETSGRSPGEICIGGRSVSGGYWKKDNSELFITIAGKPYLRTGDLGFIENGELYVHGRIKEMLIVRGKNIYPNDIEDIVAAAHEAIDPNGVAVFSIGDEENVVIGVEIKRTYARQADGEKIIAAVDNIVAGTFGIDAYDIMLLSPFALPKTTSGKLQRIQCKTLYAQKSFSVIASKKSLWGQKATYAKDPRLLQAVLNGGDGSAIKEYVLNCIAAKSGHQWSPVNIDQLQLTEIGIDSLRAMELINTINKELGIQVEPSWLLRENSLPALITLIESILWLKNSPVQGKEITI